MASLWDLHAALLLKGPLPHLRAVQTMLFNPAGDLLVTTSADRRGRVWNAITGELLGVGMHHRSDALSHSFSDDGKLLATGGIDNQAAVWDLANGEQRTPPLQHQGTLRYVGFGQDNNYLLSADEAALRVWRLNSLPEKVRLPDVETPPTPRKEALSADGRLRVDIRGNVAQINDVRQNHNQGAALVHASAILFAAFSSNSEVVVTTSEDNTARLWNALTGELLTSPLVHNGDVLFAAFSPDGKELITASDDRTARLWDVATGEPLSPSWPHDARPVSASFSPDGLQVFTRDALGQLYTWDITPDGRPVDEILFWAEVVAGSRFLRNRGIIPLEADGLMRVWNALQAKREQK
jgi:WD40 repeat protein